MWILERLGIRRKLIPERGVHIRTSVPVDVLMAALADAGWPVFVIGGAPRSAREFIAAVSEAIPTDPLLGRNEGWDALSDSVFGGLRTLPGERAAIVWPESTRLALSDHEAYRTACEIFRHLVPEVAAPATSFPVSEHPTRLLVLLA